MFCFFVQQAASWTNYFQVQTFIGRALISTIVWICACAAVATAVFFARRERFALTGKILSALSGVWALGIIVAAIVQEFRDESFAEQYQMWILIGFLTIVIGAFVLAALVDRRKVTGRAHTMEIVYAAICIAISFALSYVRMFKAPYGGSITLAQLAPLAIYAYMFGWKKGVLCGLVFGLLQSITDPWVVHPIQYLLDYPLAFALIGLSGVLRNTKLNRYPALAVAMGLLIGVCGRFACHLLSGAIYFGSYGAEYGFASPWVYSLTYNSLYVWPDGAIAIAASALALSSKAFRRQIESVVARYRGADSAAQRDASGSAQDVQSE